MTFPESLRRSAAWLKHFVTNHTGEIVWAFVFALALGWFFARLTDPPKPDLRIVVVTNKNADDEAESPFKKAIHDMHQLTVGTVPVAIDFQQLNDKNVSDVDAAVNKAKELVAAKDVLMVIADLQSNQVEASLPFYFGASPKVPVLTTGASDDDLLVKCNTGADGKPVTPPCDDSTNFVPLLQLSPTNRDQGRWAIAYATEHGKRRFMIVYDDSTNKSYAQNLSAAYEAAVKEFEVAMPGDYAEVVGPFSMDRLPTQEDFVTAKPDCILYAGAIGNVKRLLGRVPKSSLPIMVLLSDSAVQQNIPFHEFGTEVQPINFTYQADEYDYNHRRNAFSQDSIAIASELISDLNKQLNFTYKLKALLGWETAMDTRRALVSVMKQNEDFRTAYDGVEPPGEPLLHPSYVFENHKRVNGMFHVLQLQQTVRSPATQMADVDNWHPKRALPAGEQSAQASTRARSKTLIAKHVSDP